MVISRSQIRVPYSLIRYLCWFASWKTTTTINSTSSWVQAFGADEASCAERSETSLHQQTLLKIFCWAHYSVRHTYVLSIAFPGIKDINYSKIVDLVWFAVWSVTDTRSFVANRQARTRCSSLISDQPKRQTVWYADLEALLCERTGILKQT